MLSLPLASYRLENGWHTCGLWLFDFADEFMSPGHDQNNRDKEYEDDFEEEECHLVFPGRANGI